MTGMSLLLEFYPDSKMIAIKPLIYAIYMQGEEITEMIMFRKR